MVNNRLKPASIGLSTSFAAVFGVPAMSNAGPANGFRGLGDLPGGSTETIARAISADGTVVVGSAVSDIGRDSFRWTATGGMVGLGTAIPFPGTLDTSASGVSADGSVLVGYRAAFSTSVTNEAYRWTNTGGLEFLGDIGEGDDHQTFVSAARDVSADGSIVVGRGTTGISPEPFRWSAEIGMVGLGDLPGGADWGFATGISAGGAVIVGKGWSGSGREAFRWTESDGMVGLGDLAGGDFGSGAEDVSADGSTIVGAGTSSSLDEAFIWTEESGMVGLGDLPGGSTRSQAFATSADGSVVAGYGTAFENFFDVARAFY